MTGPQQSSSGQFTLFDLDADTATTEPAGTQTEDDAPSLPEINIEPENQAAAPETGHEQAPVRPWESLPVGEEADGHALIVTAAGTYTPSGQSVTGPVDSVEKLDKLIRWAPLSPRGLPAQIWFVGIDACTQLGWVIDPGSEDDVDDLEQLRVRAAEELCQVILATIGPLTSAGWELRGDPGHVIRLSRTVGKATHMVDVVLEPYVWTYWNKDFGWGNRVGDMGILGSPTAGTYLPDEDQPAARELGRRLAWSVRHLGILPGPTPARTGAAVLDKIRRERTRSGKGIVVTGGSPMPPIDGAPRGDLEPPAGWARPLDNDDFADITHVVTIDQRAAYLASAGMLSLGYGTPRHLAGPAAVSAAAEGKPAFGIWRVTLPASGQYALPEKLPMPHPAMEVDQPVQTWITTVSLEGLCAPIVDGGMGLEVDDLDVVEAWVYPEQGRALDKWAKVLREGRAVAEETGDLAMKRFLGAVYKGYIGRMVNPDMWTAKRMQHHHQPLWRAAIIAHCRWRGRRVAMRIAAETGRWPIRTITDSWVYLLGDGQDIADDSPALGKMVVEKQAPLTDETILALAEAESTHDLRVALDAAFRSTTDDEGEE